MIRPSKQRRETRMRTTMASVGRVLVNGAAMAALGIGLTARVLGVIGKVARPAMTDQAPRNINQAVCKDLECNCRIKMINPNQPFRAPTVS